MGDGEGGGGGMVADFDSLIYLTSALSLSYASKFEPPKFVHTRPTQRL